MVQEHDCPKNEHDCHKNECIRRGPLKQYVCLYSLDEFEGRHGPLLDRLLLPYGVYAGGRAERYAPSPGVPADRLEHVPEDSRRKFFEEESAGVQPAE